jgi:hypothetical protein
MAACRACDAARQAEAEADRTARDAQDRQYAMEDPGQRRARAVERGADAWEVDRLRRELERASW